MKKRLFGLIALAFVFFLTVPNAFSAAPNLKKIQPKDIPLKDLDQKVTAPFGSATAKDPLRFVLYERTGAGTPADPFQSNPVEIVVPNLPAWNPAVTGETYEKASQRKAETMAKEINTKMGAGRATAGTYVYTDNFGRKFNLGIVTVTNVHRIVVKSEPTRQGGNGSAFRQGVNPPKTTPYPGSMGTKSGLSESASGKDPYGAPSFIQWGITDRYVATVNPLTGALPHDILADIKTQLDSNGLPVSFINPYKLEFDEVFGDDKQFFFSSTDTGINFEWDYGAQVTPEPVTMILFGTGLLALAGPLKKSLASQA